MKIGYWNVNGLGKEKCKDEEFIKIIKSYDILCLTESWREDGKLKEKPQPPPGYREKPHNRKNKHKKAKRNSGGISIMYKSNLDKFIKIKNDKNENILWLKIDKNLVGTSDDFLLGTAYFSPREYQIWKEQTATDAFEILLNQVECFSEGAPILLGGDFNARIGTMQEHVGNCLDEEEPEGFLQNPGRYSKPLHDDNDIALRDRVSQDKNTNAQGMDLRGQYRCFDVPLFRRTDVSTKVY